MMRSHTCNDLNDQHVGQEVTLCGWVHRRRDHGGLIFIDLRDRYGLTQVVSDPAVSTETHEIANNVLGGQISTSRIDQVKDPSSRQENPDEAS